MTRKNMVNEKRAQSYILTFVKDRSLTDTANQRRANMILVFSSSNCGHWAMSDLAKNECSGLSKG